MEIRPLDPERDTAGCVAINQQANPYTTRGVDAFLYDLRTTPERARSAHWVAVDAGEVVGYSSAGVKWFASVDSTFALLQVRADARRRGIGTALWERAEHHLLELGIVRTTTTFTENEDGVAFARARGFAEERAETLSSVDPRVVAPPAEPVVPLSEVDARAVYDIDVETTPDVPTSDDIADFPYDEWFEGIWSRPAVTHEGSFGALVDGRLAAFTLLAVNRDLHRGFTEYTATLRAFRGRGLAERVKRASLAWSAENGIERVWTTNDERNAAMLHVNDRLGYEVSARRVEYLRTGTTTSPLSG